MRIFNFLLLLFIFTSCNKKEEFIKSKINLSIIDSLKTNQEIENLIGKQDSLFKKFKLKKIIDLKSEFWENTSIYEIAKREKLNKSFEKVDFDNNGLTDILVIGENKTYTNENLNPKLEAEFSLAFNTLILMNYGKNNLKLFDISEHKFFPIVPKVEYEKTKPILIVFKPKIPINGKRKEKSESKSKLVYEFNSFIELNETPKNYNINKIEFETKMCAGTCPIYKFEINKNEYSKLEAIENNFSKDWQKGKFIKGNYETKIKKNEFTRLKNLLNYIDFVNLENDYNLIGYHYQSSTLKVHFNNGKVKIINDFGMVGSYGLKRVYDILSDLRFNQNWK